MEAFFPLILIESLCRRVGSVGGQEGNDGTGVSGMLTEKGQKTSVLKEKQQWC